MTTATCTFEIGHNVVVFRVTVGNMYGRFESSDEWTREDFISRLRYQSDIGHLFWRAVDFGYMLANDIILDYEDWEIGEPIDRLNEAFVNCFTGIDEE